MKKEDFEIGGQFRCGDKTWRCTDIGSRVIVAICLEPSETTSIKGGMIINRIDADQSWFTGPPYGVPEHVFDEYDIPGCEVQD